MAYANDTHVLCIYHDCITLIMYCADDKNVCFKDFLDHMTPYLLA